MCYNDSNQSFIAFIEVKYHKSSHGRIGFGNGQGQGFQPEILKKRPNYFEKYMRWVIASSESSLCLFFSNEDVRNNCANKIEEGKQNNFTNNLFEKNKSMAFKIEKIPSTIVDWLTTLVNPE